MKNTILFDSFSDLRKRMSYLKRNTHTPLGVVGGQAPLGAGNAHAAIHGRVRWTWWRL